MPDRLRTPTSPPPPRKHTSPRSNMKLLYIASSSYSGSTMLAFLLNTHPDIFTVGEMDGWRVEAGETFPCSCGQALEACRFFQYVCRYLGDRGVRFDTRDFNTRYRLATTGRMNRMLTARLPTPFANSTLEKLRDTLVWRLPPFGTRLSEIGRRNELFIESALTYSGARVFVDGCKDPHRLRHLRRIRGIELYPVHLVRDFHGVVLSNLEQRKEGWNAQVATRIWIRDQCTIKRVLEEFDPKLQIYYEDLCDDVDGVTANMHRLVGLTPQPYPGSLKAREHHVLGNSMRLSEVTAIVKSERWRDELSKGDRESIEAEATRFVKRHPRHTVSRMIERYLD